MKKMVFFSLAVLLAVTVIVSAATVPKRYRTVAPEKIGWKETGRFPVAVEEPVAIAVDPTGDLRVAGKKTIGRFSPEGKQQSAIGLEFTPSCFTVAGDGTIFAASGDRVWRVPTKEPVASEPVENGVFTSIVATEKHLFVADAGNRCVWQFDRPFKSGKLTPKRFTEAKFVVPSPYFDMALGSDGLLRIVDPGRHRIKHFTEDGHHETPLDWGKYGFKLDEFPTCCNPAHIAMLSDGLVVTVEKKIPRVKVYSLDGKLQSVVVDPAGLVGKRDFNTLAAKLVVDVAVGPNDVIYLLDPIAKEVRKFGRVKSEE